MKKILSVALLGVALVQPAQAAPKDIATISCDDVKAYDTKRIMALVYWLEGYWQGQHKTTMLQPEKIDAVMAKMDAQCQDHLDRKMLDIYLSLRGDN